MHKYAPGHLSVSEVREYDSGVHCIGLMQRLPDDNRDMVLGKESEQAASCGQSILDKFDNTSEAVAFHDCVMFDCAAFMCVAFMCSA